MLILSLRAVQRHLKPRSALRRVLAAVSLLLVIICLGLHMLMLGLLAPFVQCLCHAVTDSCLSAVMLCAAGLVAQQQCVGPLQLPISDVAVFAQSHQDITGIATSIGEQV